MFSFDSFIFSDWSFLIISYVGDLCFSLYFSLVWFSGVDWENFDTQGTISNVNYRGCYSGEVWGVAAGILQVRGQRCSTLMHRTTPITMNDLPQMWRLKILAAKNDSCIYIIFFFKELLLHLLLILLFPF